MTGASAAAMTVRPGGLAVLGGALLGAEQGLAAAVVPQLTMREAVAHAQALRRPGSLEALGALGGAALVAKQRFAAAVAHLVARSQLLAVAEILLRAGEMVRRVRLRVVRSGRAMLRPCRVMLRAGGAVPAMGRGVPGTAVVSADVDPAVRRLRPRHRRERRRRGLLRLRLHELADQGRLCGSRRCDDAERERRAGKDL